MTKKIKTTTDIDGNISVENIDANDIDAHNIDAHDIDAHDIIAEGSIFTGSHPLGGSSEVVNVVYGVSNSAPDPTTVRNGTIYIQYID